MVFKMSKKFYSLSKLNFILYENILYPMTGQETNNRQEDKIKVRR